MWWSINEIFGISHKSANMKLIDKAFSVLEVFNFANIHPDFDPTCILAFETFGPGLHHFHKISGLGQVKTLEIRDHTFFIVYLWSSEPETLKSRLNLRVIHVMRITHMWTQTKCKWYIEEHRKDEYQNHLIFFNVVTGVEDNDDCVRDGQQKEADKAEQEVMKEGSATSRQVDFHSLGCFNFHLYLLLLKWIFNSPSFELCLHLLPIWIIIWRLYVSIKDVWFLAQF